MMKTNELRIGNLIKLKSGGRIEAVREVLSSLVSINASPVLVNTKVINIPVSNIEPIPLTEEWLLKFGFNYPRKGSTVLMLNIAYQDSSYPCSLQVSGSGIEICRSGIGAICPKIEYVHQLQNLYFTLTGKELAIKELST